MKLTHTKVWLVSRQSIKPCTKSTRPVFFFISAVLAVHKSAFGPLASTLTALGSRASIQAFPRSFSSQLPHSNAVWRPQQAVASRNFLLLPFLKLLQANSRHLPSHARHDHKSLLNRAVRPILAMWRTEYAPLLCSNLHGPWAPWTWEMRFEMSWGIVVGLVKRKLHRLLG